MSSNKVSTGSSQLSSPPPVDFLYSTPPSITRVLTYTSPLIHLFSYFLSLVTWSTGNPSESCLLVAAWWTVCLYTTEIIIYGTHLFLLAWIGWRWVEKGKSERLGKPSSASKSTSQLDLDRTVLEIHKISDKLTSFHALINSIRSKIDWANSAQTQKVIRGIIYSYPAWLILTYFIPLTWIFTILGTFGLVWHSPWFKFTRYALMQSALFRGLISLISVYVWRGNSSQQGERGFSVGALIRKAKEQQKKIAGKKVNNDKDVTKTCTDLIFRFVIYENQRWWLGLDWTTNLFLNERPAWSDEYNEPTSPKSSFQLPSSSTTNIGTPEDPKVLIKKTMEWKWDDADWWIDYDGDVDKDGWEYADNRWKGFSSKSGFRRYTRRRKWVRTARLVETIEKLEDHDDDQATNDNQQITEILKDFDPEEDIKSPSPYSLSSDSNNSSNNISLPLNSRKPNGKFDAEAISLTSPDNEKQNGKPVKQNSL
ncbi:integral peroxisomal membrane peroxin-domain-containing protein [Glomus cerebriforme]|uniref:Integral peroxisomal membrane peroxin-domain-containing protein n=1 Tax=Glomus cerebriforme TaxID=658196 RepID=A0A397SNN8_9GLOM|nr:integral peroxisomal membrane peroxin-domain-containing protein [Glomus cerebriforme]